MSDPLNDARLKPRHSHKLKKSGIILIGRGVNNVVDSGRMLARIFGE